MTHVSPRVISGSKRRTNINFNSLSIRLLCLMTIRRLLSHMTESLPLGQILKPLVHYHRHETKREIDSYLLFLGSEQDPESKERLLLNPNLPVIPLNPLMDPIRFYVSHYLMLLVDVRIIRNNRIFTFLFFLIYIP